MTRQPRPADDAPMVEHALWYATERGWYVVPLHQPLFDDDGNLIGCTCEAYKRSKKYHRWLASKGWEHKFDPDFKCPPQNCGKHPRLKDWEGEATTDEDRIRAWWRKWPKANIGLAPAKSGLLTMDLDKYKDDFAGADLLTREDEQTITQLSGRGGAHLVYAMPEGKTWGNGTGELPDGVDIRGWGGMQVIAPSLHPSGKRYQWELDYGPDEIDPLPVPGWLATILDDAATKTPAGAAVKFDETTTERPDLADFNLADVTIEHIHDTAPLGERSEHDQKVITALVYAGLTDEQIRAVFQHYPIGTNGKYAENGDRYLATSIGNARAWVAAHPDSDEHEKERKAERRTKEQRRALLLTLANMGSFRLNTLEDTVELDGRRLDDVTLSRINLALVRPKTSRADIADAINVLAGQNAYHPVREYLLGLTWDGQPHLGDMLACFDGDGPIVQAPFNPQPLHNALIYRWLLGCVAKALEGETKSFPTQNPMLVLIGKQGLGKSSWVRWLASGVGGEFHREGPLNPHSVDDQRTMVTAWLWEVSELGASMRKADKDALKSFITTSTFTYRRPYGKFLISKPGLCSLVGTLNPQNGFLDDATGHRRFLPASITDIDYGYSSIDVNQLWAQLVHLYRHGELPYLTTNERAALAAAHEDHEIENPLQGYLLMYFEIDPTQNDSEDWRCHTSAIIARLKEFDVALPGDLRVAGRLINDTLAPMGLDRGQFRKDGIKTTGWIGIRPNGKTPVRKGYRPP